ncbi:MAG: hypothetical protein J5629_09335 [Muribaculaceae bacterium]|nr:hypothetical protein [Muribaculaceae bacterium]
MKTDANLHPFPIPIQIFQQKIAIFAQYLTPFYVSKYILRKIIKNWRSNEKTKCRSEITSPRHPNMKKIYFILLMG